MHFNEVPATAGPLVQSFSRLEALALAAGQKWRVLSSMDPLQVPRNQLLEDYDLDFLIAPQEPVQNDGCLAELQRVIKDAHDQRVRELLHVCTFLPHCTRLLHVLRYAAEYACMCLPPCT